MHFIIFWAKIQTEAGFPSVPTVPHTTGAIITGFWCSEQRGREKVQVEVHKLFCYSALILSTNIYWVTITEYPNLNAAIK